MTNKYPRLTIIVLAFIVLRTLFALVWDVTIAGAKRNCYSFADTVLASFGTNSDEEAVCKPNNNYATVGHESGSFLILDMGAKNEITDQQGIDFYYYEREYEPGILLDQVEVAVAQDDGSGNPLSFIVVFVWGDENPDNNGVLPSEYLPEEANDPIDSSDLFNTTGIGINIGNDDGAIYRFVRFRTYPIEAQPASDELVEVDAIEVIAPPIKITPFPSPFLTERPSPTPTLIISSETPFDTPTFPNTLTETSTITPIGATTPPNTATATLTQTNAVPSATHTVAATATITNLPSTSSLTNTPSVTSTPSPTRTLTATRTSTATSTVTASPTVTAFLTITPTSTPSRTPIPSSTRTSTAAYTPMATSTVTSTPTISRTPRPRPTRTSTKTEIPYAPGTGGVTLTASAAKTATKTPSATFAETPTPTITLTYMQMATPPTAVTPTPTPSRVLIPRPWVPTKSELDGVGITIIIGVLSIIVTLVIGIFQFFAQIMPANVRTRVWKCIVDFPSKSIIKNKDTRKLINTAKVKDSKKPSNNNSTKRKRK